MPELSPYVPAMSAGESKPTHLSTPGCAHLVVKLAVPGGGVGVEEEGAEPTPEPPSPPPPPQAATVEIRSAIETSLMAIVRALMGGWWPACSDLLEKPHSA
jgi:hypothetical protein